MARTPESNDAYTHRKSQEAKAKRKTVPTPTWTPRPFNGLRCHCGELHHQNARYYVTVRPGRGCRRRRAGP